MTRMTRLSTLAIPALVSAVLGGLGCSSSNNPAIKAGAGGGSNEATGGSTSTSTSPAGGSNGDTGGSGATDGSTGGSTAASTEFQPVCSGNTVAGVPVAKGGQCAATDPQMCYKTCGPQSIGFKSETCAASVYVEQSGCSFPSSKDYSCYKIPTAIDPSCPTTTPKASDPCTVAACILCQDSTGAYLDSGGNSKQGYCVCPASSGTSGSKWSCASSTAWPCPAGQGC